MQEKAISDPPLGLQRHFARRVSAPAAPWPEARPVMPFLARWVRRPTAHRPEWRCRIRPGGQVPDWRGRRCGGFPLPQGEGGRRPGEGGGAPHPRPLSPLGQGGTAPLPFRSRLTGARGQGALLAQRKPRKALESGAKQASV
jgi:hypothetical protein